MRGGQDSRSRVFRPRLWDWDSLVFPGRSLGVRLVLNPSSFCQVTNNYFPPSSWRVSETQHLFSRDLQSVTHLLWRLCIHISSCIFTITRQKRLSSHPVMNNPPSAPELLLPMILHGPAIQLLRLVTPLLLAVQLQVLLQDQGEPSSGAEGRGGEEW